MESEPGALVRLAVIETKLESVIGELARLRRLASRPTWAITTILSILSSSLAGTIAVLFTHH